MPQNWKTYKLGDLISINSNNLKRGQFDWINYIDIKSVSSGTYGEPTYYKIGSEPSRAKRVLNVGDTVISSVRPNLKAFFYCQNLPENAIASTGFAVLSPDKIDSRFLYYLTTNDNYIEYLVKSCTGSAYPAFNPSVILDSIVTIPKSIEEQRSIASILSALDVKIELNLQMNRTLEEMAMALYKHWFVDFGPFKDGKFVESELGMIPEGWEVKLLGEVCRVINGRAYKNDEFLESGSPIIRIQNLTGGGKTVYSNLQLEPDKYVESGDLIYAWSATFGPYIWHGPLSIYHYHIWKLEVDENQLGKFYLYHHLHRVSDQMKEHGTGSIFTHLTKASMEAQKILVPHIKIKKDVESKLSILHSLILSNKDEIETIKLKRDSLLQKLISGEITVK